MKRLLLAFLMLLTCFGMTSCSSFFGEEEALVITSIRREDGKNEKGEDGFYIIIEYANEYKTVDKFFVPNGKKGETGLEGNGIKEIKTEVNEETKETTVTIIFTDETMEPVEYKVPLGVSLSKVVPTPNPDGLSTDIQFEFSDGSKSEVITLPKGEKGDKGDGFQIIEIKPNPEDGSTEIIIQESYKEEPISIVIPRGQEGRGIRSMVSFTNGDKFVIQVQYSDGEFDQIEFDRPNTWLKGTSKPYDGEGMDGDFYFDISHKIIYAKESGMWLEVVRLQTSEPQMCTVHFHLNDEGGVAGSMPNDTTTIRVIEGTYFGMNGENPLPIPTRKDYVFDGWYLSKNPTAVNGRFTDTTPVYSDLHLYAKWVEKTQA